MLCETLVTTLLCLRAPRQTSSCMFLVELKLLAVLDRFLVHLTGMILLGVLPVRNSKLRAAFFSSSMESERQVSSLWSSSWFADARYSSWAMVGTGGHQHHASVLLRLLLGFEPRQLRFHAILGCHGYLGDILVLHPFDTRPAQCQATTCSSLAPLGGKANMRGAATSLHQGRDPHESLAKQQQSEAKHR